MRCTCYKRLLWVVWIIGLPGVFGQAVNVTLSLDANSLEVDQQTTLRVFAQIDPSIEPQSLQIFSWYMDVLNTNALVGQVVYSGLTMSTSDNIPELSSSGSTEGGHRRGIYNTFMNTAGAGKGARVELLRIDVTALAPGTTEFMVQAGTTVTNLAHDFIVATTNQPHPFTGGDYTQARATLTVSPSAGPVNLDGIRVVPGGVEILFTPALGRNHMLQYNDDLLTDHWTDLPGGPHNTGRVIDSSLVAKRYYRLLNN